MRLREQAMSAVLAPGAWIDVPGVAIQEMKSAQSIERFAMQKSRAFRALVIARTWLTRKWRSLFTSSSRPSLVARAAGSHAADARLAVPRSTFSERLVRWTADRIQRILDRMTDQLILRAVVFENLQTRASEDALSGRFGDPVLLLRKIEEFRVLNESVMAQCRLNAQLLRSIHSKSRIALAFDRLEAAAQRLADSVLFFVPVLQDAESSAAALRQLRQLNATFDRQLETMGEVFTMEPEAQRRAVESLAMMSRSATSGPQQ